MKQVTELDVPEEEYEKALKEAKTKPGQSYLLLEFRFVKFILPYDQGIKVLEGLKNVEAMKEIEWGYHKVCPTDSEHDIKTKVLTHEAYIDMKMRNILGITKKPDNYDGSY